MAVEEKWSEDQPIPFLFFGSILTTLGFLQPEIAEDSEDFLLVRDIWNLLEGHFREGVSKQNLLTILLIIRGVCLQSSFKMSNE
jgi:hypothetical protein